MTNTDTPLLQWLIPVLRVKEDWRATQTDEERDEQLQRAEDQRRRRAERNLKIAKGRR